MELQQIQALLRQMNKDRDKAYDIIPQTEEELGAQGMAFKYDEETGLWGFIGWDKEALEAKLRDLRERRK